MIRRGAAAARAKPFGEFDGCLGGWDLVGEPYTVAEGQRFLWFRARMLGGRTNHWGRISLRFGPWDFKARSRDGLGDDWPIGYEDLAPYYDKLEEMVGLFGTREGLPNEPDGIFQPPPAPRAYERLIQKACGGLAITCIPSRLSILTRPLNGRPACHYCGQCGRGCSTGSNFSTPSVLLPPALQPGRLQLVTGAMAREVLTNDEGLATGVSYVDTATGREQQVRARIVVLAASACETARLLLNSKSPRHPAGLANSSGAVGRHLTDTTGASLAGHIPALEALPPHNEDGAGGIHVYMPWWLDNRKLDFPRGYHIEPWGGYSKGDEEDDLDLRDPRNGQVLLRHGAAFFNSFRDLTASGFWSSKMGTEDLAYIGNTFVAEWQGPPPEVLRKLGLVVAILLLGTGAGAGDWPPHDRSRPAPKVVDPGTASNPDQAGRPPSDAIVLFGGKDLSMWKSQNGGGPAGWRVENGYMEVVKGTGSIETAQGFGDCQLHVEWASPLPAAGEDQARGNSGVFLMGQYEVQVLDSYQSATYPDGQAAAVYGQYPPLVNASRPPGQWQAYDIVFRAPRFDAEGRLLHAARLTVLHNGILVQDGVEPVGPTAHQSRPPYKAHPAKLPLSLQDHSHPVRFRNIWIRELSE